jgi:transposase InsO family protein
MEEIIHFVMLAQRARFTVSERCEQFGISRKTGYKHWERSAADGLKGLAVRSHRPHPFPQRTDPAVEALILAERRRHRTWGPKKLHKVLAVKSGRESPPARSTSGEILRRHGLSVARRRKPGMAVARNDGLTVPTRPHHVWTVDFKGWFLLGHGQRCDPLPGCDRYSRYLLACRAQPNQQCQGPRRTFQALMRQGGVPEVIRVDNGTPFAALGLGRLASLSLWWIEPGLAVALTRPASPQDNGLHERRPRDLKAEAITPSAANQAAQQRRFDRWQQGYNYDWPHESLNQQRPGEFYQPSSRRLHENDKPLVYPADCEGKRVSASGFLAHGGKSYHVGEAFAQQRVGLHLTAKGQTELYLANVHLGNLTYGSAGQFRPSAYIAPPNRKPLAK